MPQFFPRFLTAYFAWTVSPRPFCEEALRIAQWTFACSSLFFLPSPLPQVLLGLTHQSVRLPDTAVFVKVWRLARDHGALLGRRLLGLRWQRS